jgi:hypothetical protein
VQIEKRFARMTVIDFKNYSPDRKYVQLQTYQILHPISIHGGDIGPALDIDLYRTD